MKTEKQRRVVVGLMMVAGFIFGMFGAMVATIFVNRVRMCRKIEGVEKVVMPAPKGLFGDFYAAAEARLAQMSDDEKIGQLLIGRYRAQSSLADQAAYQLGGFVFFEKDFTGKTKAEVMGMTAALQAASKVPTFTAVDEEGGVVSRLNSNLTLVEEVFRSPRELFADGGFEAIEEDLTRKNRLLAELGLNLNLAPVVDVSTNPEDFIFERTLGQETQAVSEYAARVTRKCREGVGDSGLGEMEEIGEVDERGVGGRGEDGASKHGEGGAGEHGEDGTGNSGVRTACVLKHFPGYGNNRDTHTGGSVDEKSLVEKEAVDLPPFSAGIAAGAEAVMISHNIVQALDGENPASLSPAVHDYLRGEMGFQGVVITDDISMGALAGEAEVEVRAVQAGGDLIITSDYPGSFERLKTAVAEGRVMMEDIEERARRILAWKGAMGMGI